MKIIKRKDYVAIYGNTWPLRLARLITFKDAKVTAFPPFIFYLNESFDKEYINNHELIHFIQMYELLFIFAFFLQKVEYFYARFLLKKNKYESYLFTSLEQEAYLNHGNKDYLKTRKPYRTFHYIFHKKTFLYNRDTGEVEIT